MENKENPPKAKSYRFALRIINLYKHVTVEHKEYVLSKQVLRSGTSIGANIVEANHAQSKPDYIHELSISLKESHETQYWLELLRDGGYLPAEHSRSIIADCGEIQRMLTSSIKTAKSLSRNAD